MYNGEKSAYSINGVGRLDNYIQKNLTGPLSHSIYKNKLKMD